MQKHLYVPCVRFNPETAQGIIENVDGRRMTAAGVLEIVDGGLFVLLPLIESDGELHLVRVRGGRLEWVHIENAWFTGGEGDTDSDACTYPLPKPRRAGTAQGAENPASFPQIA